MRKKAKTAKPYADFPMFYYSTGQWAKKISGRMHYFGTDAHAALKKYLAQRDDLQAGRTALGRFESFSVPERNTIQTHAFQSW
jgi:hypothetical protein